MRPPRMTRRSRARSTAVATDSCAQSTRRARSAASAGCTVRRPSARRRKTRARRRSRHAFPELGLAEQREPDVAAHAQAIGVLDRDDTAVGLAVLAIVDEAAPLQSAARLQLAQQFHTER